MPGTPDKTDTNGARFVPYVTLAIIAINVAVTVFTRRDLYYYSEVYVSSYGLIPATLRPGALFTSAFIHDGYVHLTMNMALLYVFGSQVELVMGKLEYVMFYIGACFAASLTHVAIVYATLPPYYSTQPVVGASGAVAGVMGFYAVRFHRREFALGGARIPALLLIMLWLILQLGMGILGLYRDEILGIGLKQVGYWSHLGGFAFGIIVALAANMALEGEREYLLDEARANCEDGNLLEAVQNHETLLKHDPTDAHSHAECGRLWALLEEEAESLRCFQVAIEIYISQGKEKQALGVADDMKGFWRKSAISPATGFRLGVYLAEAGQTELALRTLERVASDSPDSPEAEMSLLKIGQLQLSALDDPQKAESTLKRFLERYPESRWRRFAEETLARAEEAAPRA
jgi:membrane associated rhomboid family serine protease